jgi:hypothetical protein
MRDCLKPGKEDVMTGLALAIRPTDDIPTTDDIRTTDEIRAGNEIRLPDESFFENYFRKTGLKERHVFRLFKAALKNDERLIDDIVASLYAEMKAFDRERADDTIEIVVDHDPSAAARFRALLKDMWPRKALRPQFA